LGASEADACAMLKEERAATLTQFLVTRLVMQGGEEADGTLVSQDVQKTHEFAVEAARCRHNQREKGLVVVTEVIWTVFVALRFRHSRVNEHLCQDWGGEADRDVRGRRRCHENHEQVQHRR